MFVSTTAENLVSLSALFTKLHSDFHSLYILEFHGKAVNCYNIKLSMSVLFCKKTNILSGRFYEKSLLVGFLKLQQKCLALAASFVKGH